MNVRVPWNVRQFMKAVPVIELDRVIHLTSISLFQSVNEPAWGHKNDITPALLTDYPHVDKNSCTCVTDSCCNVIILASHWNMRQNDVIRFLHCVSVNTPHKYLSTAVPCYVRRGGQNIGCLPPTRQRCIANCITSRDWQIDVKWSVNCDESFREYNDDFPCNKTITSATVNRYTTQVTSTKLKLRGLSLRANYTDRATATCRRSYWQILRIEGATWSA
jgi:hypothetical protein